MRLSRIAGFCAWIGVLGATGCGTPAEDLQHVWDDLTAMGLVSLPTLGDYAQRSRWTPSVLCAGGQAAVQSDVRTRREGTHEAPTRADQTGLHDIVLRDCRPDALTYSGDLQRELELTRSLQPAASRTVDWLHGSVHLTGAWEDTCYINLRGVERAGHIVYRGRLCDEQVEHALPVR